MIEDMNLNLVLPKRNFVWTLSVLWKSISVTRIKGISFYHSFLINISLFSSSLRWEERGGRFHLGSTCKVNLLILVGADSSVS